MWKANNKQSCLAKAAADAPRCVLGKASDGEASRLQYCEATVKVKSAPSRALLQAPDRIVQPVGVNATGVAVIAETAVGDSEAAERKAKNNAKKQARREKLRLANKQKRFLRKQPRNNRREVDDAMATGP
jgi:hypothetical protein